MIETSALSLNSDCYCWPVAREQIVEMITRQDAHPNMAAMLAERPHYFASTATFVSSDILNRITQQIRAIEAVIKLPAYIDAVKERTQTSQSPFQTMNTRGAFMGYDFHVTEEGARLIEINSNAGGAFIVDMIEHTLKTNSGEFAARVKAMFEAEWAYAGRTAPLRSIAIVDTDPTAQYHYPDMCLAKSILETQGLNVVITDPADLRLSNGRLYHGANPIDLVYNRLTDFGLDAPENAVIKRAYDDALAVITPVPHHHALYADKRNLILLSDAAGLAGLGATQEQIDALRSIPKTVSVTGAASEDLWGRRRTLFFKPQAGFGSRGVFRGAKLTKKVWGEILQGGYIAQDQVAPPLRAVTVNGEKTALKFDVRVYTYDGEPLLLAALVYQGQTTNLRTVGGGLAAVIPVQAPSQSCSAA